MMNFKTNFSFCDNSKVSIQMKMVDVHDAVIHVLNVQTKPIV